jgi:hypothetical protein
MENLQSHVQGAELEELDALDASWDDDESDREISHRLALMRIYFARFGLADREALEAAARRVVVTVRRITDSEDDGAVERRLVAVARSWVRDFAESVEGPGDWLSRAPALLSKFPSAFLTTPL